MPTYREWCDVMKSLAEGPVDKSIIKAALKSIDCPIKQFQDTGRSLSLAVPPWVPKPSGLFDLFRDEWSALQAGSRFEHGAAALDLGSGAGPHSMFLAARGFSVTSIDFNELAAYSNKVNFALNSINLDDGRHEVMLGDFSTASFRHPFDLIVTNPPLQIPLPEMQVSDGITDLDDALFSFITNSWRDGNGASLLDLLMRRSASLLKSNGIVIICSLNLDADTCGDVLNLVEKAGFRVMTLVAKPIPFADLGLSSNAITNLRERNPVGWLQRYRRWGHDKWSEYNPDLCALAFGISLRKIQSV